MNIVVIVPTYNERENIGRLIDVLVGQEFPKIKNHKIILLVVDDNSPDGTGEIVKEKTKEYQDIHLLTGKKQGLGHAYIRGMKYAMQKLSADAVVEMDADFQHDPNEVKNMVKALDEGYDYVIGSRYIKGGSIPAEWEWYRKFLSIYGNLFIRFALFLFKVHDVTTGFRATRVKGYLDKIDLDNLMSKTGYAFKVHLLYETVKLGAKVKEIPIQFAPRKKEVSKFKQKETIDTLLVVFRLFIRSRFFKFGVVGFVGYLINAVGLEFFAGTRITEILASTFSFLKGRVIGGSIFAESSAWAAALAAEVAIMSNYTFNNFWTFSKERITNPIRFLWKFSHFNLTSFGAILIQFAVVGSGVFLFGDTALVRQLSLFGSMPLVLSFNYTMYNVFIWKTWLIPGLGWLQKRK